MRGKSFDKVCSTHDLVLSFVEGRAEHTKACFDRLSTGVEWLTRGGVVHTGWSVRLPVASGRHSRKLNRAVAEGELVEANCHGEES